MSELEVLLKNWSFPARSPERAQLTLRIPLYDHQRLLALKELYPNRSINDMVVDILEAALNDIVSKLPINHYTEDDIKAMQRADTYCGEHVGESYGQRVWFNETLKAIQTKHQDNSKESSQAGNEV